MTANLREWVDGDRWAVTVQGTSTGGNSAFMLLSENTPMLRATGRSVIVDGCTIAYFGDVKQLMPQLYSSLGSDAVCHTLTDYANTLQYDSASFVNLNLPMMLEGGAHPILRVVVIGDTALLDVCEVTVWGRFVLPQTVPTTQPVSVDSINVWPWKKAV